MDVIATLKTRKDELNRKQVENSLLVQQIADKQSRMYTCAEKLQIGQDALQLLEDIANSRRGAMRGRIEEVVSEALRLVYGEGHRIELIYDVKNNRSHLEIVLVVDTPAGEVRRTMKGFGGGVSDVISVPMRLLVLLGSRDTDRVCVLDEAYKHVDVERIESVARFVSEVSQLLGIQVIMPSHHGIMSDSADVVYHVSIVDGKSIVEKV